MKAKLLHRAQAMIDHHVATNRRTQAQRKTAAEPEVGIIFVYDGRLLIDGTTLREAEDYGDFKGHARGHDAFWHTLQRNDIVPRDVEYDEVPRGRVAYDKRTGKFNIFVDKCIQDNERMLDRVKKDMNLPSSATMPPQLDAHYRCPDCVKSDAQERQEEEDWNL